MFAVKRFDASGEAPQSASAKKRPSSSSSSDSSDSDAATRKRPPPPAAKPTPSKKLPKPLSSSSSSSDSDSDSNGPPSTPKPAATPSKKAPARSVASSDSSSDSDSDAPAPVRKPATPSKKPAASSASSSSSSSSSSDSDSSDSDSDASPRKKAKGPPPVPAKPAAPANVNVSASMFGQFGFMIPSGAPPTADSLAREAKERQAMLEAAEAARKAAAMAKLTPSPAPTAEAPKLKQITAKQAIALTKVAKLNAAQAAKLNEAELAAYRAARAEEKKAKKALRKEGVTPEQKAAAKTEAKKQQKEAAKAAAAAKEQKAAAAAAAAEAPVPKAPREPKVVAPVVPSASAATNPALRSEGLKKKDEAVRAAERAERKRARREAMGLPPEEEEKKVDEKQPEETDEKKIDAASSPIAVLSDDAATSHKRKLDDMREARMAAVQERDQAAEQRKNATAAGAAGTNTSVVVVTPSAAPVASEVNAALHAKPLWMLRGRSISSHSSVAVEDFALDERIKGVLRKMNITRFFAAQSELLPVILKSYGTNDICCCAPTGSGKTLAYLLPLVQSLSTRILTRLRALILLPSRDLALQVLKVLQPFTQALGFKVECILGQSSFAAEQARLVTREGTSAIDILICTPGRLMDHLAAAESSQSAAAAAASSMSDDLFGIDGIAPATPVYNFHLRDLQYLVVDEVDRLLTQVYQDWPAKILGHIYETPAEIAHGIAGLSLGDEEEKKDASRSQDELRLYQHSLRRRYAAGASAGDQHLPLQKMLFSATLTNNPQKLQALQLHNPLFFTESTSEKKKFAIPVNLKQWLVNLPDDAQKPIVLIHLLKHLQAVAAKAAAKAQRMRDLMADTEASVGDLEKVVTHDQILIFTASVESTHRLARLLEVYDGGRAFPAVAEFSSALTQQARTRILRRFARGECKIVICSDAMARGMDLANVDTVISYDVPQYIQTYVHRVGRTARAGAAGSAYTMVKAAQFRNFKSLLHQADNSFYSVHPVINDEAMRPLMPAYQQSLTQLKNVLALEKQGEQNPHQPINETLRSQIAEAAAAAASAVQSAAEVDEAINADLEDKKASKQPTQNGTAPMPIDTSHAKSKTKPSGAKKATADTPAVPVVPVPEPVVQTKKERYNLIAQSLAGQTLAKKVLL